MTNDSIGRIRCSVESVSTSVWMVLWHSEEKRLTEPKRSPSDVCLASRLVGCQRAREIDGVPAARSHSGRSLRQAVRGVVPVDLDGALRRSRIALQNAVDVVVLAGDSVSSPSSTPICARVALDLELDRAVGASRREPTLASTITRWNSRSSWRPRSRGALQRRPAGGWWRGAS